MKNVLSLIPLGSNDGLVGLTATRVLKEKPGGLEKINHTSAPDHFCVK